MKLYNKNVPIYTKNNFTTNIVVKNQNNSKTNSPEKNLSKYKPESKIIDQRDSRSITPKLNNQLKNIDNLKSTTTNQQNYYNQILFTETAKYNSKTNSNSSSKDTKKFKIDKINDKLFPIKKIVNNKNLDATSYLDKIKKSDFSCCSISNISYTQEKLYKYCYSKNISIREVLYFVI